MRPLAFGFVLLGVLLGVVQADFDAPQVAVNLDLAPEQRWTSSLNVLFSGIRPVAAARAILEGVISSFQYCGCDGSCMAFLAQTLKQRYPVMFSELQGVADVLVRHNINVTAEQLAGFQYLLEIEHSSKAATDSLPVHGGCTSMVACDSDGNVVQGRNLDFSPVDAFRAITSRTTWTHNGATLFESGQFILDIGVTSGVAKGKLSISQNWRSVLQPLQQMLACISDPTSLAPIGFAMRSLLETGKTFDEAIAILGRGKLCTPGYLIVAGPGKSEGVVLTKPGLTGTTLHEHWVACNGEYPWHAVQANTDWWVEQPQSDNRMGLAIEALSSIGQAAGSTATGQMRVLSVLGNATVRGVLNTATVFSTVMSPAQGLLTPIIVRTL